MSEQRIEVADNYTVVLSDDAASYVLRHGIRREGSIRSLEYLLACEVRDLRAIIAGQGHSPPSDTSCAEKPGVGE